MANNNGSNVPLESVFGIHGITSEKLFCGAVLIDEDQAKNNCAWLEPAWFQNPLYGRFWEMVRSGIPASDAAIRVGTYQEYLNLVETMTGRLRADDAAAYARSIREDYFAQRYADLPARMVTAMKTRDFETVRELAKIIYDHSDFIAQTPDSDRFRLHTAAEALQPLEPIPWRIKNLIEAGGVYAICGDAGSGKTYLTLDIGVKVANGDLHFGDFEILNHCPVLIVDEESGDRRLKRRLSHVMRAHNAPADIPLHYVTMARFDIRNKSDVNELKTLIEQTRAGLVVIDAFMDVIPGADENSSKDLQPGLLALGMLAKTTNAAILLIHHTNKAGGYRGSTAIKGSVDGMFIIEKTADSPVIEVKTEKARDIQAARFTMISHFSSDPTTGELAEVRFTAADPKEKKPQLPKAERYVVRYLGEHHQAEITAITSAADTCTEGSARKAVYSLVDKGFCRRVDSGGPGVKATYALTERGDNL